MKNVLAEECVELMGETYVVYLKEVPARVAAGGEPLSMCVKAFVKKKR